MLSNPLVSVVMPTFNMENYLSEAIASVLEQTFCDFELIIIDDGSTDSSFKILDSLSDKRIKIIRQVNQGVARSLNVGINIAAGKYIARMDADDICMPNRFEIQFEFMERNPDYIAVGTNADVIDESGKFVCRSNQETDWNKILSKLPNTPFIHPSVMFRRDACLKVGSYPDIPFIEDDLFFYKMAKAGKMINLTHSLIKYRLRPSAVSTKSKKDSRIIVRIINRTLESGVISEEDSIILKAIMKKSKKWKESYYFMHIGKQFLWRNYSPGFARRSFVKSLLAMPINIGAFILLIFSFFPKQLISFVYDYFRSKKNI